MLLFNLTTVRLVSVLSLSPQKSCAVIFGGSAVKNSVGSGIGSLTLSGLAQARRNEYGY